ncbi:unnamed protein product [Linum trigynum]|uniref:Uncharacterized protein n=1 Tax=Linum trigynum TaxID=586398 RepID=A0AAV2FVT5_9ROSI
MGGTRRVDRMVYRYPNRQSEALWHEEFLITTQAEVDSMVEFLTTNNISKAEMFVYTEPVAGAGGHYGEGQTSGIHSGGGLYEDHPYQIYHDRHSYNEYQEGEAQGYTDNQDDGYQYKSEYDFHAGSGSYHNYHYGDDVGAFHDLDEMEDVLPGPIRDPEDEEEEGDVSAYNFDPLEGADDSGPDSHSDDDEVSRDRVPISYYKHIPNEDWYVDADMEPPEVPIWGPLTGFTKGRRRRCDTLLTLKQ